MTISEDHFLLSKSIYLEELGGHKTKQNRRLLKTLLQGQLSMECILVFKLPTHAEHQKLGLSLSPILTGLGYCELLGLSWIVTHSSQRDTQTPTQAEQTEGVSVFTGLSFSSVILSNT